MAKLEFDITGRKIATIIGLLAIGAIIGFLAAGLIPVQPKEIVKTDCLTAVDLNRQDMIGVIQLSRFCEGLGLNSNVLPQRDFNGNEYFLPVCTIPVTQ